MEFKAELVNGELIVKPIIVKDGGNVTVHMPSFQIINKLKQEYGIRNIQQI